MDHWKGLSTVFNCWNFCFTIITQWWAMVDFITQNGPIFHKIFKIFVVINQKLCDVCGQKLIWVVSTISTTNSPSFVKIREVTQNSLLIWHGMTQNKTAQPENIANGCPDKVSEQILNYSDILNYVQTYKWQNSKVCIDT